MELPEMNDMFNDAAVMALRTKLNPPVDLERLIPVAINVINAFPSLADQSLLDFGDILLKSKITDLSKTDDFVKLLHSLLKGPSIPIELDTKVREAFSNVPYIKTFLTTAQNLMLADNGDRRSFVMNITTTMWVITALVIIGRIWSRLVLMKRLLLCDYILFLGFALSLAFSSLMFAGLQHAGLGLHLWHVSFLEIKKCAKLYFVGCILYACSITVAKMSFLLFYPEISKNKKFILAVKIVMVIQLLHLIAAVFTISFQCTPVDFWNYLPTMKCIDRYSAFMALGIQEVVLDVVIFCLPLSIIFSLKLDIKDKLIGASMFLIGCGVCVISAYRLRSMYALTRKSDITWHAAEAAVWCLLEVHFTLICASIPALRALFVYYWRHGERDDTPFGGPAMPLKSTWNWPSYTLPSMSFVRIVRRRGRVTSVAEITAPAPVIRREKSSSSDESSAKGLNGISDIEFYAMRHEILNLKRTGHMSTDSEKILSQSGLSKNNMESSPHVIATRREDGTLMMKWRDDISV